MTILFSSAGFAATYYIGSFSGSTPSDNPSCGTRTNPCQTLAYWNQYRRNILQNGDVVRLTGVFDSCTGNECGKYHCLIAAQGVTYEGRSQEDIVTDNYMAAIIDGVAFVPSDTPGTCGRYIVNGEANLVGINWQGFTLRDMTIRNAPFASGSNGAAVFNANPANCGGSCSNLTIDRVRFTGMVGRGGLQIGNVASGDDNICPSSRSGSNITVVDSDFDFNDNTGLVVVCMSNVSIARNTFHDNYPADCDPQNPGQCPGGPCDNADGLIIGSSGIVEDNEAWNNAQTDYSFGSASMSTCDGVAHDIIFQRNIAHDPICGNHVSIVHCARNITLRNNFIWGKNRNGGGVCFNQKQCSWRLKFYSNTCWGAARALQWWENCYECEAVNNIFVNDNPTIDTVFMDEASTAPSVRWENNVVFNLDTQGNQVAMRETSGGSCTAASGCPTCNGDPEAPNYPDPELMTGWDTTASTSVLTNNQVAIFQAGGDMGQWFGSESGDTDKWGIAPAVIDPFNPNVANLHLSSLDTVAMDAGQNLFSTGFNEDFDTDLRIGVWDIGADEFVSTGAVCGNNIIESGEDCEPSLPLGKSCIDLGYSGGTLSCTDCAFDVSACTSGLPLGWALNGSGNANLITGDPQSGSTHSGTKAANVTNTTGEVFINKTLSYIPEPNRVYLFRVFYKCSSGSARIFIGDSTRNDDRLFSCTGSWAKARLFVHSPSSLEIRLYGGEQGILYDDLKVIELYE